MDTRARSLLTSLFEAAIRAADPLEALASHLPAPPMGRTVVIGAGKGAAQMAAALEQLWERPADRNSCDPLRLWCGNPTHKGTRGLTPRPRRGRPHSNRGASRRTHCTSPPTISLLPLSAAAALPCSPRPLMVSHWKTNKPSIRRFSPPAHPSAP